MIDAQLVKKVSNATHFRSDMVEQVFCMMNVLKMIVDDPILGKRFVLIGGTAINLFNPKIPRLSVDIDFDYVHRGKAPFKQDLIETHSDILNRIAEILVMDYYRTTEKNSNRLGVVFYYKSNFTPSGKGEVKLDILNPYHGTILKHTQASSENLLMARSWIGGLLIGDCGSLETV